MDSQELVDRDNHDDSFASWFIFVLVRVARQTRTAREKDATTAITTTVARGGLLSSWSTKDTTEKKGFDLLLTRIGAKLSHLTSPFCTRTIESNCNVVGSQRHAHVFAHG